MLPARLDEYRQEGDPHHYGLGQRLSNRGLALSSQLTRPRDLGAQGDNWRAILLDTYRRKGVNFFGT